MFDFSHVSAQLVGFAVFVGLLALRCGLLWVIVSAATALVAASNHSAFLAWLAGALQGLARWSTASATLSGW